LQAFSSVFGISNPQQRSNKKHNSQNGDILIQRKIYMSTPPNNNIVKDAIPDFFQSYGAVFFSFGMVALAGTILTFFLTEKSAKENGFATKKNKFEF